MTDKPDTSSEAVERLAADYALWGRGTATIIPSQAADTLRALLAEREAALAQVAASEAKLVTMIEAREARTSPALPPAPSDTRGWSGMAAGTHMGGQLIGGREAGTIPSTNSPPPPDTNAVPGPYSWQKAWDRLGGSEGQTGAEIFARAHALPTLRDLEQRVAALEQRMRNR